MNHPFQFLGNSLIELRLNYNLTCRFSALSKPEEEGRSRYGVSPARDGGRGRGFGRPRGITPRSSQEQEKERALAAAR